MLDVDIYKLWRIFNFVCETDADGCPIIPIVAHSQEIAILLEIYLRELKRQFDKDTFLALIDNAETVSFEEFISLFEKQYTNGLNMENVRIVIDSIYEDYVEQIIKTVGVHYTSLLYFYACFAVS
jgi:hypothetical protein